MNMKSLLAGVAIATALTTGAANAAVNFYDNFDAESAPGVSILNYNGFANWDVLGQVDLVSSPNPYDTDGIGNYVDLDGSSGPGAIVSKQSFAFAAGDFVTFSFEFSGNQRDQNSDTLVFGLDFDGPGTLLNLQLDGGAAGNYPYSAFNHSGIAISVGPNVDWTKVTYTFQTSAAGAAKIYFGTTSADNIGPLVDNVSLTAAVPEPATWAMMILGFGAAGSVMRRRRAIAA